MLTIYQYQNRVSDGCDTPSHLVHIIVRCYVLIVDPLIRMDGTTYCKGPAKLVECCSWEMWDMRRLYLHLVDPLNVRRS